MRLSLRPAFARAPRISLFNNPSPDVSKPDAENRSIIRRSFCLRIASMRPDVRRAGGLGLGLSSFSGKSIGLLLPLALALWRSYFSASFSSARSPKNRKILASASNA